VVRSGVRSGVGRCLGVGGRVGWVWVWVWVWVLGLGFGSLSGSRVPRRTDATRRSLLESVVSCR